MAKLTRWGFADALVRAGVFSKDQINDIRRVVIDCPFNDNPVMYVEMSTSPKVMDVFLSLDGIKIVGIPTEDIPGEPEGIDIRAARPEQGAEAPSE
jgi:hypothetical protein